jgi:hypothetical protein
MNMKNLLLLVFIALFAFNVMAQRKASLTKEQREFKVEMTYNPHGDDVVKFNNAVNPLVSNERTTIDEAQVGYTWYDLQTNSMVANRLRKHDDGTVGVTWTFGGSGGPPAFPDRGTGYNYYDGSAWAPQPDERIEDDRTGWPNYDAWGPNGEIVVSHHNNISGLYISTRENKGTGEWVRTDYIHPDPDVDPTWPRMVTSGENKDIIHIFYNTYNEYEDMVEAVLYSRSDDGGESWDPQGFQFDDLSSENYSQFWADNWVMASRGDVVAFLAAHTWYNDVVMMKSEDNGDSWETTIIREHPYPFFDWDVTLTDTFWHCDNSAAIAIDPDGKVHVAFGLCRVVHAEAGQQYFLWPYAEGIVYWNEDMPVFGNDIHALAPPEWGYPNTVIEYDYNYIGWLQDFNENGTLDLLENFLYYRAIGSSNFPALTIDEQGRIFLAYSSLNEERDNFDFNFRDILLRAWDHSGGWGPFVVATRDIIHIFDECIYPQFSPTSDENLYMVYMADGTPGLAFDEDHDFQENRMTYSVISKDEVITGIEEPKPNPLNPEMDIYPNPFVDEAKLSIVLNYPGEVVVKMTNMAGQMMYTMSSTYDRSGIVQFTLPGEGLQEGVYFCTVTAEGLTKTLKLVKK